MAYTVSSITKCPNAAQTFYLETNHFATSKKALKKTLTSITYHNLIKAYKSN